MLAPWAPEADVTVTLVNQTKTRDREFVVREELAARASAESTYGSLLSFGKSGTAVGVADLVDRAARPGVPRATTRVSGGRDVRRAGGAGRASDAGRAAVRAGHERVAGLSAF